MAKFTRVTSWFVKVKAKLVGAVERLLEDTLIDSINVKAFGAIGDGVTRALSTAYSTLAEAQAVYPFVTSLTQSLDWAAIQAAFNSGRKIHIPKGDFMMSHPVQVTTIGQIVIGEGTGWGYGEKDAWFLTYQPQTRLIPTQAFERRLMTRRLARTSASDPTDALMNAMFEIHAEGVKVRDLALWLDCDYTNTSPTNKGLSIDVGFFVSSRCGVVLENTAVFGYFRKCHYLFDITRSPGDLPELLDYMGNPVPVGIPFHGGDGTMLINPYTRGANVAVGLIGAIHSDTGYWNESTGALVTDRRGESGFSDFYMIGHRLYCGGHHSGYRLKDPSVTPLTRAAGEVEDIYSPSCFTVDGYSANGSTTTHGVNAIRGIVCGVGRFTSTEMFRVRLLTCDEVYIDNRAWSEGGTGTLYDTNGNVISATDYTNYTYGHVYGSETKTGSVRLTSVTGGIAQRWISAGYWHGSDAYGYHRMRGAILQGDSTKINSQMLAMLDVSDLASTVTKYGLLVRSFVPSMVMRDNSAGTYTAGFVNDATFLDMVYGSNPADLAALRTKRAMRVRQADDAVQFNLPFQAMSYTVATLPTNLHTIGAGFIVYCSNGKAGSPCLAYNSGGVWRVVGTDNAVSAT